MWKAEKVRNLSALIKYMNVNEISEEDTSVKIIPGIDNGFIILYFEYED